MDTELVGKILRLIDRDLIEKIAPGVSDEGIRIQIDYMSRLLNWSASQVSSYDRLAQIRADSLDRLVARFDGQRQASIAEPDGLAIVDDQTAKLRHLAENAETFPELYADYVQTEQSFVRGMDAREGNDFSAIYRGGRIDPTAPVEHRRVDADGLTHYLRRRFPGNRDAVAENVRQLPGGFGKDTILFTIRDCPPHDGDVVMRKDFAISASPGSVTDEFALLKAVQALGIPVAPPLWAEHDASAFGGAFIISRKAAGSNDISSWAKNPEARRHCVDQLAQILAGIHAIDPASLGRSDTVPAHARDAMRANMLRYYNHYRDRTKAPVDRIEVAFAWLLANLPTNAADPARLLHGDIGFQNLLTREGEIEAVLDWEFSGFGDPAADIGYAWQFIAPLTNWTEFGAMYQSHGGVMPAVETANYFKIWGDIRNACVGVGAAGVVDLNPEADLRSPAAGLGFGPLCEIEALAGTVAFEQARRSVQTSAQT